MEINAPTLSARNKLVFGLREKLLALFVMSALAVAVGQSFENKVRQVLPENIVFRSVINKKASGLSALFTIAGRSGLPCQLWILPYRRLKEVKGLLYVVDPRKEWTTGELKEILAWVEQGNELIYFAPFSEKKSLDSDDKGPESRRKWNKEKNIKSDQLLKKLGLSADSLDKKGPIYDYHLPEMAHVKNLLLTADVKIVGGKPIVACKGGAYITAVKYGLGKILIGGTSELCANEKLNKSSNYDNFQFMVNCFRTANGVIFFDEHCHGIEDEGNVFVYFSRQLPGLICWQLFLMLIVGVLGTGLRFGAFKSIKTARQISDLAYVEGLANVYKRAQANLVALEIIVGFWRTKLCRELGLSARSSKEEILIRAKDFSHNLTNQDAIKPIASTTANASSLQQDAKRYSVPNAIQWLTELEHFLNDYDQALAEGVISKARLTQLIRRCDALSIN